MPTYTVSKIVSDEELNSLIQQESHGDPNIKAPTSSATGLGQFLDGTWLEELKEHKPEFFNGPPYNDELALRKNPSLMIEVLAGFAEDNARVIGVGFQPGDLYLAHFSGAGTARKLFKADPSTPTTKLYTAKAIAANKSVLQGKTAGQVRAWAAKLMAKKPKENWVAKYYKGPGVGKPSTPDVPEISINPLHAEALSGRENALTMALQKQLVGMNYFVGLLDGKWGGQTRGQLAAFLTDRQIQGEATINDDTLAAVSKGVQDGWKKPVGEVRKSATPDALEKKLPEVAAAREAKKEGQTAATTSWYSSIVAAIATVTTAVVNFGSQSFEALSTFKGLVGDVPLWVWLILFGLVSGGLYFVSRKSQNAADASEDAAQATTNAFKEGARV